MVDQNAIALVRRTIIYDLIERMFDPEELIDHYTTDLDLNWISLPLPQGVKIVVMASADQDLDPGNILQLNTKYGAVVADWESGSIARVASKNKVACLILRGVSDLVCVEKGDAYDGNHALFSENALRVMSLLVESLPFWLAQFYNSHCDS